MHPGSTYSTPRFPCTGTGRSRFLLALSSVRERLIRSPRGSLRLISTTNDSGGESGGGEGGGGEGGGEAAAGGAPGGGELGGGLGGGGLGGGARWRRARRRRGGRRVGGDAGGMTQLQTH